MPIADDQPRAEPHSIEAPSWCASQHHHPFDAYFGGDPSALAPL
jgi:hypothetical protein